MDQIFTRELQNKYLNQMIKDDSIDYSSHSKDPQYWQQSESEIDIQQKEEPISQDDFRYQIGQRFNQSRANKEYKFPRITHDMSDESFSSMKFCGVYDLNKKISNRLQTEPIDMAKGKNHTTKHKTPSTDLFRPRENNNPKNKRLKTEGNEKCEEAQLSFHFESNHNSGRSSLDVVRLGQEVQHNGQQKFKVVKNNNFIQNQNNNYQGILNNLHKKLHQVNIKEDFRNKTVPMNQEQLNPKPISFYDCDKIYGQSKKALKKTLSNRKNGSLGKASRVTKTSQGHYDSHDFYDNSSYNTKVKSNSNSTAHQSQFYSKATQGSKNNILQKTTTEVNQVNSIQKQHGHINTMNSESRSVGLSKAYLQPNTNQNGNYRNKVVKRPETQQDLSRPQTVMSQSNLSHEYLLKILSSQKPTVQRPQSRQAPAKVQISTNVQNPIFNLNNSNINLYSNYQGTKHNRAISTDMIQQTMAVAEMMQRQGKKKIQSKQNIRSSSSQQQRNNEQKFNTEPDEDKKQNFSQLQRKYQDLSGNFQFKFPKRTLPKQKIQSRCNTEQQQGNKLNASQYLRQVKQNQTMQLQNISQLNFFQAMMNKPTKLKEKFSNLKIHVDS